MTDVTLAARLDPTWNRVQVDFASASEADLRYRSLLGDVEFRVGDADFSTQWGWIPLMDFVLGLRVLLARLSESRFEAFEFTESGAELRFEIIDGAVEVRSNFTAAIGHTSLDILRGAVRHLADEILLLARQAAPAIDTNPNFERMARDLTGSE